MKHRSHIGSPTGTGGYSRQVARYFLSRAWLDRPLPTAPQTARVHLTIRLEVTLGKAVAE